MRSNICQHCERKGDFTQMMMNFMALELKDGLFKRMKGENFFDLKPL